MRNEGEHSVVIGSKGVREGEVSGVRRGLGAKYVRYIHFQAGFGVPIGCPLLIPSAVLNNLKTAIEVVNGSRKHAILLFKLNSISSIPIVGETAYNLIGIG